MGFYCVIKHVTEWFRWRELGDLTSGLTADDLESNPRSFPDAQSSFLSEQRPPTTDDCPGHHYHHRGHAEKKVRRPRRLLEPSSKREIQQKMPAMVAVVSCKLKLKLKLTYGRRPWAQPKAGTPPSVVTRPLERGGDDTDVTTLSYLHRDRVQRTLQIRLKSRSRHFWPRRRWN